MPSISRVVVDNSKTIWTEITIAPNGQVISVQNWDGIAGFNSLSTSKSWVRTPNFWALRRTGAPLPENNFSYQKDERGTGYYDFQGERRQGQNRQILLMRVPKTTLHNLPDHGASLSLFDLQHRLISRARTSDFSLPITLVEGRRTVGMVAQTATNLAGVIYNLRRGNLTGALGSLGIVPTRTQRSRFDRDYGRNPAVTAGNYWLQYQYGWKPLLSDVKNAAEALAKAVSRNGESMVSTIRATTRLDRITNYPNYTLMVNPQFKADAGLVVKLTRRAVWRFCPRAADLPGLFGLTNPAEVLWEVIPYSFVADWFLPIGKYLSTLDAPLRFQHVSGSTGYRSEETISYTMKTGGFIDGHVIPCVGGGGHTVTKVFVQRERMSSIPNPRLADMHFTAGLNAVRATSAIALLLQQASRLGR